MCGLISMPAIRNREAAPVDVGAQLVAAYSPDDAGLTGGASKMIGASATSMVVVFVMVGDLVSVRACRLSIDAQCAQLGPGLLVSILFGG